MFNIYDVFIMAIIAIALVLLARGGAFSGSWNYGKNSGKVHLMAGSPEAAEDEQPRGKAERKPPQ